MMVDNVLIIEILIYLFITYTNDKNTNVPDYDILIIEMLV